MMRRFLSYALAACLFLSQAWAGNFILNPYSVQPSAAQDIVEHLTALSLTSGLQFCLDAGDSASAATPTSKWLDISANGQSFFTGVDGSGTDEPTYNGSAGGLSSSEYFSFDGGDLFQYDTSNETWMQNIHKNNGVGTFIFWVYGAGSDVNNSLVGTSDGSNGIGFWFRAASSAGTLQFNVRNGAGEVFQDSSADLGYDPSVWQMTTLSFDESAGTGFLGVNANYEDIAPVYSSPSSSDAVSTMQLGSRGSASTMFTSGGRMAIVCGWNVALSKASVTNILAATRGRFGV